MKKRLSYRDKLLELAYIYNVKEIQEYTKRRKNLTTGQIELILKKNKIIIPKEFKTNFIKENFEIAFGQHSGVIDVNKDKFELPRFPINEEYGDLERFDFLTKFLLGAGLMKLLDWMGNPDNKSKLDSLFDI